VRILLTSPPGWGHGHRRLPRAAALVAHGVTVLWATAVDSAARIAATGVPSAAAGLGERDAMAVMSADPEIRALTPEERPAVMGPRLFGAVRAPAMLSDLMPIAREFEPELIVADTFEFAAPIVARLLGVRNLSHSFGPLIPGSRIAAGAAYVEPLWQANGLEPRPYGGVYDHLYLDVYPPSLSDGARDHLPPVQLVRPVEVETGEDEELPGWITAGDDPLIYVTMGTVFSDTAILSAIVNGVRHLEARVLVTVGPQWDAGALGEQPSNVHVAQYVPQRQILPHATVVISHGGSGTFLGSVAAGLPQVLVPQGADQFLNAEAAGKAGVAVVVPPAALTPEAITDAVAAMLAGDEVRSAAGRVAQEIAGMPTPEEVAAGLRP
jgi:UDP:flavonoid glycosyltransferase YjiC (YdhE family)